MGNIYKQVITLINRMCGKRRSDTVKTGDGKIRRIDECMAFCIHVLNENGIETLGSCCGHGKYKPSVIIRHNGSIMELISGVKIDRESGFYAKDSEGLFAVPECLNKQDEVRKKQKEIEVEC